MKQIHEASYPDLLDLIQESEPIDSILNAGIDEDGVIFCVAQDGNEQTSFKITDTEIESNNPTAQFAEQSPAPDPQTPEQSAQSLNDVAAQFAAPEDPIDPILTQLKPIGDATFTEWFEQLQSLMQESDNLSEFRDKLTDAYPDLDAAEFKQAMLDASVVAGMQGYSDAGDNESSFAMSDLEVEFKIPEGSTKIKNGVNYILQNSRWRRADPTPKATSKRKSSPSKSVDIAPESKAEVKPKTNTRTKKVVEPGVEVEPKAKTRTKKTAEKPVETKTKLEAIPKTIQEIEKELGADKLRRANILTENLFETTDLVPGGTREDNAAAAKNTKNQRNAALAIATDINQVTRLPIIKDREQAIKILSELPDGHIVVLHQNDRAFAEKLGLKPITTKEKGFDDRGEKIMVDVDSFAGTISKGKLTSIPANKIKQVAGIRKERALATKKMESLHFDKEGLPRVLPPDLIAAGFTSQKLSAAGIAKIEAEEDKHHEKIDRLENAYLGRQPTGKHGDYDSYATKASDWAKAKFGDFNEGANGFSLAQTKAHDIAHPVTHELTGMDSDKIHAHFGKMKDAKGNDALYAEEAIVNVMEQLSRGVSVEASILNGVRLARVMTRGGVGSPGANDYVRSGEFAKKLGDLANKAYRHNDFAPLIGHVRKSNRMSGTVTASGDNFTNSASGG